MRTYGPKALEMVDAERESLNILIVDDEPDIRELIEFEFESEGHRPRTASSGRKAILAVRKDPPDLVVTDIRMPDGDGIELLKFIKAEYPKIPVVFISGYSDISIEDAFDLGVEAVFAKPFSLNHLLEAARKITQDVDRRWKHQQEYSRQRSSPRMVVDLASEVRLGASEAEKTRILNVGRGGAFFSYAGALFPAVGDEVSFKIPLVFPDGSRTVMEGAGIVRWVRKNADESQSLASGFGIEFVSVTEGARSKLIELINAQRIQAFIPKT